MMTFIITTLSVMVGFLLAFGLYVFIVTRPMVLERIFDRYMGMSKKMIDRYLEEDKDL